MNTHDATPAEPTGVEAAEANAQALGSEGAGPEDEVQSQTQGGSQDQVQSQEQAVSQQQGEAQATVSEGLVTPPPVATREPTGDVVVDGALEEFDRVTGEPLDAHVEVGEKVHRTLQARLADLGDE